MIAIDKTNVKMKNVKMKNNGNAIILKASKVTIFVTMIGLAFIPSINKDKKIKDINRNTDIEIELLCDKEEGKKEDKKAKTYKEILCEKVVEICPNYTYVFGLNDEVLSNVVKKYINNSQQNNLISNNNILGTNEKYDTIDIQIVLIAKELAKNPSKYGYKKEEAHFPVSGVKSDLTIREIVYKYADAFNLDREYMLAIACAESGWFKEPIAIKKNNPYGHRNNGVFFTYSSLEKGILEGELNLKLNYFTKESVTIDSCAKKHCPESPKAWANLVKGVYRKIVNGYSLYDEEKNKNLILGSE